MEWRIESWACDAGRLPGSSSWLPCGGWKQGFCWARYREDWRSAPRCCIVGGVSSGRRRATPFPGQGQRCWSEGRVAELERKIGQQAVEIDFLKGCLQRIEERRMLQASTGSPRSRGKSVKK